MQNGTYGVNITIVKETILYLHYKQRKIVESRGPQTRHSTRVESHFFLTSLDHPKLIEHIFKVKLKLINERIELFIVCLFGV